MFFLVLHAAAVAKLFQSCPTLCNPIDGSPPGSPIPGILQARTLEWVAFPSPMHESEKWKWSRSVVSDSLQPHGLQPTRLLHPWDFPGKSTGVGCCCLLPVLHATCGLSANTASYFFNSPWIFLIISSNSTLIEISDHNSIFHSTWKLSPVYIKLYLVSPTLKMSQWHLISP